MFVYLISDGEGRYKIGWTSKSGMIRMEQLQVGCASKLIMLHECAVRNPTKVEAALHRRYAPYRLQGEWFELPITDVMEFNKNAIKIDNMITELSNAGNPFV